MSHLYPRSAQEILADLDRECAAERARIRRLYPHGRTWAQIYEYLTAPLGDGDGEVGGADLGEALDANYRRMMADVAAARAYQPRDGKGADRA